MKASYGTGHIPPVVVAVADADAAAEEATWGAAAAVVVGVEAEVVGGGDPASGPIYLSVPPRMHHVALQSHRAHIVAVQAVDLPLHFTYFSFEHTTL